MKQQIPIGYYSEEEVAALLNKSIASLRSEASRRKGAPRTKLGKLILYKKESFEKWLDSHETNFQTLRRSQNAS
ncbi:MAG: helix-turn-helix domain-containing protein [Rickettsiales bacterium]|nr:helix-turn-helix domain-containing protein [Rickettsiales bacterium]